MEEENIEKDMTPILLEDLGMRYPTEESKQKKRYGIYQCQYCEKEWKSQIAHIKSGRTKSCGCQGTKYNNLHGLYNHPLYNTWSSMKNRCYSPKNNYYNYYGGRGIQVCERWLDVRNFIEDMYPSWEEGLTLDRIDVDGDYCLENCRWTTLNTQARNTRDIMSTNTSGFRGVSWHKDCNIWRARIAVDNVHIHLGRFQTALEAAKAYETYVRVNRLEHNFTPALTEEEIEALYETKS